MKKIFILLFISILSSNIYSQEWLNNGLHIYNNFNAYPGSVVIGLNPTGGNYFKLHVNGDIGWNDGKSFLSTDQDGSIELGSSLSNNKTPYIDFHYGTGTQDDHNMRIINSANGKLDFWDYNQGSVMTLLNGNITIGTPSNPIQDKLTVVGGLRLQSESNTNKISLFGYTTYAGGYHYLSAFDLGTNQYQKLIINDGGPGNVGIWTHDPIQALDINGRINVRSGVIQNGTNVVNATSDLGLYSQLLGYHMRLVTNQAPIRFFTDANINLIGGTSSLSIVPSVNSGLIGINTDNPLLPLSIHGPTNGTGIQLGLSGNVNENYHIISHNGYLQFFNGNHGSGIRLVTFRNNGNVGIGVATYNSDAKLSVDGTIKAKEIIVTQNPKDWIEWPDYVFNDDYTLLPIGEVEQFIKQNKHLPDIESYKDIEQKGINLGQMQTKILKKIEELTLYVIQLKKDNDKLQKEIEDIKMEKADK